jgi:hypothetical protein
MLSLAMTGEDGSLGIAAYTPPNLEIITVNPNDLRMLIYLIFII